MNLELSLTTPNARSGLVLAGGGARCAYQIGVLRALNEALGNNTKQLPFDVVTGVSAGSLNASILCAKAENFSAAIDQTSRLWQNIDTSKIYRTGQWDMIKSLQQIVISAIKMKRQHRAVGLLDTAPLWRYVQQHIDFNSIRTNIADGNLAAIGIAASSYANGGSICFYEAIEEVSNWNQGKHFGLNRRLGPEHIMASCAIPFVLPPVKIDRHYYSDGAIRQQSPLSSALHLGAEKLMIIGSASNQFDRQLAEPIEPSAYTPSIAGIFGHVFASAFLDSLETDVQALHRTNKLVGLLKNADPNNTTGEYKSVDFMVINPSQAIDEIAAKHIHHLPKTLNRILKILGISDKGGTNLASFLMFDAEFCSELIELGYQDGLKQKNMMLQFFGIAPISLQHQ